MVLVLRKAGSDLPNLSLPHLSPLPVVTVPTHSLNFEQPNLAPNLIFLCFYFYFPLLPTINSSPNPLYFLLSLFG